MCKMGNFPLGEVHLFVTLFILLAAIAALLIKGGDGGPTEVRDQALPNHRHGQLHAPEGTSATDAVTSVLYLAAH